MTPRPSKTVKSLNAIWVDTFMQATVHLICGVSEHRGRVAHQTPPGVSDPMIDLFDQYLINIDKYLVNSEFRDNTRMCILGQDLCPCKDRPGRNFGICFISNY